jgi:hypothetical protein
MMDLKNVSEIRKLPAESTKGNPEIKGINQRIKPKTIIFKYRFIFPQQPS